MKKYYIWQNPPDRNHLHIGLYAKSKDEMLAKLKIIYGNDVTPDNILEFNNLEECSNYLKVVRRLER